GWPGRKPLRADRQPPLRLRRHAHPVPPRPARSHRALADLRRPARRDAPLRRAPRRRLALHVLHRDARLRCPQGTAARSGGNADPARRADRAGTRRLLGPSEEPAWGAARHLARDGGLGMVRPPRAGPSAARLRTGRGRLPSQRRASGSAPRQPCREESEMTSQARIDAFFDTTTHTVSYLVSDPASRVAAVIDPVLDYDHASGTVRTASADRILAAAADAGMAIEWLLETHVH